MVVVCVKFIGRQRELESLEKEYQRDSSFVVVYGRRRVGKTTLIKEFITGKTAFYFLATEEMKSQSIKRFAGVVSRVTQNPLLQRVTFSDWLNDLNSDTEIDVMAIDHQNKRFFAGECKYHNKPVDAPVFFSLCEKVQFSSEIQKTLNGYQPVYGIFSKSGFTNRLKDLNANNLQLFLIEEDHLLAK